MSKGSVLVTGGCGCVGYHIVQLLLTDHEWSAVHVFDLKITDQAKQDGAIYHKGNITSNLTVSEVVEQTKPTVIIHTASPPAVGSKDAERHSLTVNIAGTKNLLDAASHGKHVKAFIYTSSISAMKGKYFDWAAESDELLTLDSRDCSFYGIGKAEADRMVREYNDPQKDFRTLCLRMCPVYGVRDLQVIPDILRVLQRGLQKYQIGDNKCLYDAMSVANAAYAHVLAANELLQRQGPPQLDDHRPKIDGEAFFITDGQPIPFWTLQRLVWSAAGDTTPLDQVWTLPPWFVLTLASIVEWCYWIFTLGTKEPKRGRRWMLRYTCTPSTYSIQKARDRLGYRPENNREKEIRKGIEWARSAGVV